MTSPRILAAGDPDSILTAAHILRQGELVVLPTDTVYGLAASVFRPDAIARAFAVKRREPEKRMPVLLGTAADLPILVEDVPRQAWPLIYRFWPGPLSLVLPARRAVPAIITGGGRTLAVRVPAARSCLEILQALGEPVIGTSANLSGHPPALTARDALDQLGDGIDAIVEDDGAIKVGSASTVVELTDGPPIIHRVGALSVEEVRGALGLPVHHSNDLTLPLKRQ